MVLRNSDQMNSEVPIDSEEVRMKDYVVPAHQRPVSGAGVDFRRAPAPETGL